ncbi:MAG: hypothetical protein AABZ74_08760 [Cyanobacteriota bacterium]
MSGNFSVSSQAYSAIKDIASDKKITKDEVKKLSEVVGDSEVSQKILSNIEQGNDFSVSVSARSAKNSPIELNFSKGVVKTEQSAKDFLRDKILDKATDMIFKAMDGMGTDEKTIVKVLEKVPREERSKIRDKFNEKYLEKTGKSFDAWIDSELNTIADEKTKDKVYNLIDRSAPMTPVRKEFETKFRALAQQHWKDAGSLATGSLNNAITSVSFGNWGDGCTAWQDWILDQGSNFKDITIEPVHIDTGIAGAANHNLARVNFPDGTSAILDPWRNPDKPFHDEDEYKKEHGKIFVGQYEKGESFRGPRQEIDYKGNNPYFDNH